MRRLWTGVILLLLLLMANAYIRHRALLRVIEANALVQHTQDVLLQIEHVANLLVDAETGQRGYLYTHDPKYLEPYDLARIELSGAMQRLRKTLASSPQQLSRVQRLEELAGKKLTELQQTISLYDAGAEDEARAIVTSNVGKGTMDEIRKVQREISESEERLQAQRSLEGQRTAQGAYLAFVLSTALAAGALLLLGWLLDREMRRSQAAAAEVREQKEWFATTLRSIGDAVIATDREGRVTFLNEVAASLTGYRLEEAAGKSLKQVFPIINESSRLNVEDPVEKVIRLGTVVGLANHTILKRRDGSEIAIDDSAAPIRNSSGTLIGVVLVFRDVSQQREVESALRRADKLATAGRFAATIAHEINNPLEAAINSLYLLNLDGSLTPPSREFLTTAEQELARVAAVARQTLAFYKDTSPQAPVLIPQLLDEILSVYYRRVEGRSVKVVRNYESQRLVLGSAGELRQVFSNLILNAVDALGPGGTLTLRVRDEQREGTEFLRVDVEDTGSGIASDILQKIFEPFFTTKKDVGTGLGLWSAKNLVEKHQGELLVESVGGVTRFTVLLPFSVGRATAEHAVA